MIYCNPIVFDEGRTILENRLCYWCINKLKRPATPEEKPKRDPKPSPDPGSERRREREREEVLRRGRMR